MRGNRLKFGIILALLPVISLAQVRKEEPVGLIRVPGGAKIVRAGNASALSARTGDIVFAGDVLRSGDGPLSFTYCPTKTTQTLQPKAEVVLNQKQISVKAGKLGDSVPARACFLPAVARLGAANEQHYGVSLTRGLPQDEGLVPPALMNESVRRQLGFMDQALAADPRDITALLSRAALFEKNDLVANAAHEYRAIARLFPDALWIKGKLFEMDEALASRAAAAAAAQLGGQTYAVLVGISKYQKLPADLQLNYAHADAISFAEHLRSPRGGGLPAENVKLLTDAEATTGSVRLALDQVVKGQMNAKDTLIVFVAAHALVESASKGAFILTHDSDPQDLASTAYSMSEFRDAIGKALRRAGRVILYADVCRAGTIGSIRSGSVASSLEQLNDVEGELFGFMSAGPKELSYEGPEFASGTKHGAFTYHLLRGLQGDADTKTAPDGKSDNVITVRELIKWVPLRVADATRDRQLPKEVGSISRDVALSWLDKPGINIAAAHGISPNRTLLASQTPVLESTRNQYSLEFEAALKRGAVLPGNVRSAFESLSHMRSRLSPEQYRDRENELRADLDNRAQQILLRYLEGDQAPLSKEDFRLGAILTSGGLALTPESVLLQARRYFFEGRSLLFDRKYAEATDLLEKSIALDPAGAYAFNALGIAYLQQARYQEATAAFRDAAARASYWSYPLHNLALSSAEMGDYKSGIRYYQQAIAVTPEAGYLSYNLGILYQKLHKRSDAERSFEDASLRMPRRPEPLNALGSLFYAEGKTDRAEKLYREALSIQPDFAPAWHNLAILNAERRDLKSTALEMWERVLTIDPNYSVSRLSMAEYLAKKGAVPRAIEEYQELVRRNPEFAAARVGLAEAYHRAGRMSESLQQFRAIIHLEAASVEILDRAGDIALSLGRNEEAQRTWQRALEHPGDGGLKKKIRRKLQRISS